MRKVEMKDRAGEEGTQLGEGRDTSKGREEWEGDKCGEVKVQWKMDAVRK